eukprot:CAMPEP_0113516386 /NCGR_PEP_ID=MMETSP0014_2-20120614/41544_1 /TAXON_ID=2857 /ORGANISM="Nitzschia sp." /LENGTH=38 /DNA_ID=CAMNT_0000413205 /DNA_START=174 /DNA_END=290 /DNA_ORIENTATION=- /assembly_acc=CAM_ASM_000159
MNHRASTAAAKYTASDDATAGDEIEMIEIGIDIDDFDV